MADAILVLNAGSSSLKFSLFALRGSSALEPFCSGLMEELYGNARFSASERGGTPAAQKLWDAQPAPGHEGAIQYLFEWLRSSAAGHALIGIGHRVVHGGAAFAAPVRITPEVVAQLEALVPLAPLHQPHNVLGIRAVAAHLPDVPQIACFDTAFHRTQPPLAQMYGLPHELSAAGVRRYGFHGLSYEYIASVLPGVDARAAAGRTIACHLGNGASMCAMLGGRSIATTMGFTALDGLPMGTRSGSLDPGVLLYLMQERGMDARAIETLVYRESGLLGISGLSSDMRVLAASPEPRAREAVDFFCYRAGRELGSLAAALGGVDAIVFTAGIGEHAAGVREAVCRGAAWLGVALDESANARHERRISTAASAVSVWVIPTDEERMIAHHTRAALA